MSKKTKPGATNRAGRHAAPHRKGREARSCGASYVRATTIGQAEYYTIQAQLDAIREYIGLATFLLAERHIDPRATAEIGNSKPE